MKSLVILVALVAATCADGAYSGSNYVIPAEINNELQETYILPAKKAQSAYVSVPVSVLNTHVISPALQIRSSKVSSTQKIQDTVQKIIKKTVTPYFPTNSERQSANTYLPPITEKKIPHAHLPELIDAPPIAIQEIVKASNPTASVQVSKSISNASTLKVKSAELRIPGLITTTTPSKTFMQTAVNIASKPVQVPSTLKTKPTADYVPVIISNSSPSKTVQNTRQKPVKTSSESFKVTQKNDLPAFTVNSSILPAPVQVSKNTASTLVTPASAQVQKNTYSTLTLKTKSPEVHLQELIKTSSPPKTIPTTVISSIPPASVQVLRGDSISSSSPIKGTISKSINNSATLKTKSSDVKIVSTSIPSTPVQATQSSDTSSTIKTKLTKVQLPAIVVITKPSKSIQNTVNTSIPPAPVKISQGSDISSTLQTKSTSTSPKVTEKTVQKTLNSSPKPVQATQATSPPATIKSPITLWHLPKVIDIVQKTIQSSVNSNLKPLQVEKQEVNKILIGSNNGPENHYLPPDQNKNYESVEVFTSEGYKTERRLKATS